MVRALRYVRRGVAVLAMVPAVALPAAAQDRNLTLLGIPSATVAPAGVGYAALSGTTDSPMNGRTDGSLELGFGLGSAEDSVGVQGRIVITSLTDSFGDSGYLGVKLSRRVLGGAAPLYLGIEAEDLAAWGESSGNDPQVSVMATRFAAVRVGAGTLPVMYTLGVGSDLRKGGTRPGVFAGVGIGLDEHFGASVAWTGEAVDLGLSVRPATDLPLVMNLTLNDATDRLGEQRLSVSVAWVFGRGGGR